MMSAGAGGGNSKLISELVQQLRENKITKAQLFARLAQLPRATTSATRPTPAATAAPSAATTAAPSATASALGSHEREGGGQASTITVEPPQPPSYPLAPPSAATVSTPTPGAGPGRDAPRRLPTDVASTEAGVDHPTGGVRNEATSDAPEELRSTDGRVPSGPGAVSSFDSPKRRAVIERLLSERQARFARRESAAPAVPEAVPETDDYTGHGDAARAGADPDPQEGDAVTASGEPRGDEASAPFEARDDDHDAPGAGAGGTAPSPRSPPGAVLDRLDERVEPQRGGGGQHAPRMVRGTPAAGASEQTRRRTPVASASLQRRMVRSASARRTRQARATPATPEYDFHPRIRDLPASYGGARTANEPFEQRVARWKQRREEQNRQKRKEEQAAETKDCTFRPRINRNSKLTAERARGARGDIPVTERLYNHAKQLQHKRGVTPKRRRHRRASFGSAAGSDASMKQSRFGEVTPAPLTLKEKEELEKECTFRPKINRSHGATPVTSRYRSKTPQRGRRALPTGMEECTFTPRVNPVRRDMGLAQMYVQTEVFDRLSRPRAADVARRQAESTAAAAPGAGPGPSGGRATHHTGRGDADRPIMDVQAFLTAAGADSGYGRSPRTPASRGGSHRIEESARPRSARRSSTSSDSFRKFMARQEEMLRKKQKAIEAGKSDGFSHKPEICRGSHKLMKNRGQHGTFLSRVKKAALRKEHQALQQKAREAADPDCTFKPRINDMSKKLPKRSYTAMSRGDALKRETAQRLLRLKAEQDELAGLTFRPKTNETKPGVTGRLKILDEPDTYLERVAQHQKALADRQLAAMSEAEMQEFEECTFRPQIHDAPAYIKRIARSMQLTKQARPKEPAPREAWR